jgi:hypothetical protein
MLAELLRRLRGESPKPGKILPAVIDQVVAATDSRLALLSGFRRSLTPGIRISMNYAESLAQTLPDVLDLSLAAFTLDTRIGLFFSSPASLLLLLKRSQGLQEHFHSAGNGEDVYALLLMQRSDTLRFGVACQDGEIRSDVAQTVVSFDHHRLILPCRSHDDLLQLVPQRGLDVVTGVIARRLAQLEKERGDLEGELTQIRMRLSVLANPGALLINAMPAEHHQLPMDRNALQRRQEQVLDRLQELRNVTDLKGELDLVCHMLEHPQDYFRAERSLLYLDRMGIRLDADCAQPPIDICQEEVLLGQEEPIYRVVLPVHASRTAMAELERCVSYDR